MAYVQQTPLYVGRDPGVNEGIVTTDPHLLGGNTNSVGFSIDDASAQPPGQFRQLYVGTSPQINLDIVTTDANYRNGGTTPIGQLSHQPIPGGTKLYVGTTAGVNQGRVTNNAMSAAARIRV